MKDNEMVPSASPAALTDEQIATWFRNIAADRNATIVRDDGLIVAFARALLAAQPAEPVNPDECAQDVYKHGVSIGLFDIPKETANAICAGIASVTGARVDWHYIAGRVHMKALAAQPAADAPIPVAEVAAGNLGSRLMWHTEDAQSLTPVGTLLYAAEPAPADRQGVALPDEQIANAWKAAGQTAGNNIEQAIIMVRAILSRASSSQAEVETVMDAVRQYGMTKTNREILDMLATAESANEGEAK